MVRKAWDLLGHCPNLRTPQARISWLMGVLAWLVLVSMLAQQS